VFPLLILSKRLHSIFMLRMFNDCFTVLFLYLAIYSFQRRWWHLGSLFYSCGLGVKMNLLLVLPGLGFIFLQALGIDRSITQALVISQTQVSQSSVGWSLATNSGHRVYLHTSLSARIGGHMLGVLSNWTDSFSTNGRSIGVSWTRRRFCRSHSPTRCWRLTQDCF
jgi:hypothetical protein